MCVFVRRGKVGDKISLVSIGSDELYRESMWWRRSHEGYKTNQRPLRGADTDE